MDGERHKFKRFDRDLVVNDIPFTGKVSAVKMCTESGHTVAEVARSLGIHQNQLYNWKP
ncbi:MAG: hypothetical protein CO036_00190 [Candidatus Omnitrophica bacterium CG_4_9_14_0_2_um_filter_43_12]|nr:MAG: hypothetical protein CO036_00190 [Candidatus Omnitrophica bacterium CG_4_9_14_0_2_um_filter_43_12]